MASNYYEKYVLDKELIKDIEFVKKSFGHGSVAYQVIETLLKENNKLQSENLNLKEDIRKKDITINNYQNRMRKNGMSLY